MKNLTEILSNGFKQYNSDRVEYFNNMQLCKVERSFENVNNRQLLFATWNNGQLISYRVYEVDSNNKRTLINYK